MSLGLGLGNGNHFSGQGKQGQHGNHVGARTKRLERRHGPVESDPNTQEPAGLATTWRQQKRDLTLLAASNVRSFFNQLVSSPQQSSGDSSDDLVKLQNSDVNVGVESNAALILSECVTNILKMDRELKQRVDEIQQLFNEVNETNAVNKSSKYQFKSPLEEVLKVISWGKKNGGDFDASKLAPEELKKNVTEALNTVELVALEVQSQANQQKETTGFVDRIRNALRNGANTMVGFGSDLAKHPMNTDTLRILLLLAQISKGSAIGSGECVRGVTPVPSPDQRVVSPAQAKIAANLLFLNTTGQNILKDHLLNNPPDVNPFISQAECVEEATQQREIVLDGPQDPNYVASQMPMACTDYQKELLDVLYDLFNSIQEKKKKLRDDGRFTGPLAGAISTEVRIETRPGENAASLVIGEATYGIVRTDDGRVGLTKGGYLLGVFGSTDDLFYPEVAPDESGRIETTVQAKGLNVGLALHFRDGQVVSTVAPFNRYDAPVLKIPDGGGVEVCLDETTTATAAQTSPIISPTPLPVVPTPVPLYEVPNQLGIDLSVSPKTNTTVVGDGSDSAMWLQPANGEAVEAQIGPVRVNGAAQVSVYPHGPGVIDISNDEGPLYLYKGGRNNYYSQLLDGLSLQKGDYFSLGNKIVDTTFKDLFDHARNHSDSIPFNLTYVHINDEGQTETSPFVLGQDNLRNLFLTGDGPDTRSSDLGLPGKNATAWEASYQGRGENHAWMSLCVAPDGVKDLFCKPECNAPG